MHVLSDFVCPKNPDIEHFIHNNAISFAKQKISMTYLAMNSQGKMVGFFTLAHKPLSIKPDAVALFSKGQQRRLMKHAKFDEDSQSYALSAFLIAQFGRNYQDGLSEHVSGNDLMDLAIDTLSQAQHIIGGGVIFLECEQQPKLLAFYESDHNRYKPYSSRTSPSEQRTYQRLLRFF